MLRHAENNWITFAFAGAAGGTVSQFLKSGLEWVVLIGSAISALAGAVLAVAKIYRKFRAWRIAARLATSTGGTISTGAEAEKFLPRFSSRGIPAESKWSAPVVLFICAILSSGCAGCSYLHDVPPTKGGTYTVETWGIGSAQEQGQRDKGKGQRAESAPLKRETFTQGDNATGRARFTRAPDGAVTLSLSANAPNAVTIPPVPDYTKYIALVVSLMLAALGAALCGYGYAGVGSRLFLAGAGGAVLSLTVTDYGWLYAAAAVAIGLYVAWEKLRAYAAGVSESSEPDTWLDRLVGAANGASASTASTAAPTASAPLTTET
ncbi:MAG: hypothetical protein LBR07_05215 [Puniceicoccales bacterium]|jgi:hypothetical protein|nr:hypothetical protein [Puniceicoccales bacterium]